MALFAWSLQPVSYKFATRQSDGTLVDATESTAGARPVLGSSSSHILPLVRVVNAVAEPFKRRLVPLDVEAMTRMAVDMVGHDADFGDADFGDLADCGRLFYTPRSSCGRTMLRNNTIPK
eukprot:scaffold113367_cov66-Phaeocystis_antarctica.AAC.1